jgi:hypothetical protein
VIEGYQSFMQNQIWDLVEVPKGRKPISYKWVFQIKHKANGGVDHYKVRLVAKGFFQTQGVNFDRTYAPMVKFISINTMLALVATLDLEVHQVDVKRVFLNGEFVEDVYMMQPKGFEN